VKYHSYCFEILTLLCNPDRGQWEVGSLAGAVASIVGRSGGNTRSITWLYAGKSGVSPNTMMCFQHPVKMSECGQSAGKS
jgi:hypothetical protein